MARSKTKEVQLRANLMRTATMVESLPQLLAATGVLLQTSASHWTLLPGGWLAGARPSTALAFQGPCSGGRSLANGAVLSLEGG